MIRISFYITALLISLVLHGQSSLETYSGSFDSVSLETVIKDIETQTGYRFFYRQEWLEDIQISVRLEETPIPEVLNTLLANTTLTQYIENNQVILANNTTITAVPAISSFFDKSRSAPELEKGFVFSREYLAGQTEDIDNAVYEIGSRNKFRQGASSTIAGYVREKDTGEPVEGAFIFIEDPFTGTSSETDGFYSLSVPNGKQTLLIQSVNMKNTQRNLIVLSDGKFDINLEVDVIALNTVVVDANREVNVKSAQMGLTKINVESVKEVPVLLGEKDIMKVATTTSGVQTVGEGSAGINIRGGKADQNLFQFDGSPIYNTSHFFGFFSVINSDAVESMEIYKSGIPAKYGGRLSSVFDIKTKELNKEKFSGKGGLGPVTSRMMVEGPIFKGGPSFMLGARGTYSNYVISKIKNSSLGNNRASFYDLVGKIDYKINEKSELSLSGYYSFDSFRLSSDTLLSFTNFSYTNALLSFNYKYMLTDRLHASLNSGISRYDYRIGYEQLASQAFNIDFNAQEAHAALSLDYFFSDQLSYRFGLQAKEHRINPGKKYPTGVESLITSDKVDNERGIEYSPYFSASYDPEGRFSFYGGARYSIFNVLGPGTEFKYLAGGSRVAYNRTDTVNFNAGEIIETYHGPEFRLSSRYSLNESTSLKASYNRTRQNIHLLLNAASIAPTDIWRLSSGHIKPQIADQYSIGLYKNYYGKHVIETSAEVYYKDINNLLDFKVGADLQFNKSIETEVLQGNGRSYGLELSINKSSGWLTGWINYTYSRSLIQLDGDFPSETINDGNFFPTGYDKPHYINSITNYKFTRRYSMSLNVVYASGVPVTYPVGKWSFRNVENLYYSDRNKFRIPSYFRIDLGLNIEGSHKIEKLAHSFWTFSVYNVLGRDNIYSVFFTVEEGEVSGFKLTVFPNPIPTITYNFSF